MSWHTVLWRDKGGEYQRGQVSDTERKARWLAPDGSVRHEVKISTRQWRWWLERVEGAPLTPWPDRNPGPLAHEGMDFRERTPCENLATLTGAR